MFKLDSFENGKKKKISISIPENLPISFSSFFCFLWKLANFFFFYFLLLLEISQSYWKNVQTYSKTKFQHLIRTCSYKPPVYNTTSNRYHNPTQFFLLLKKKKKKSKGQDEQLSMETGWSKVLHGTCRFQR